MVNPKSSHLEVRVTQVGNCCWRERYPRLPLRRAKKGNSRLFVSSVTKVSSNEKVLCNFEGKNNIHYPFTYNSVVPTKFDSQPWASADFFPGGSYLQSLIFCLIFILKSQTLIKTSSDQNLNNFMFFIKCTFLYILLNCVCVGQWHTFCLKINKKHT